MATRNDAFTFMESYKRKSAKIRLLEIEAQNTESSIHRMTQVLSGECPGGSGESENSQEKMILGFIIIKEQIAYETAEAAKLRMKVSGIIDILEEVNEDCALVLRSRYLSFLSVKKSAKELGWSESRIKQLTQEGIDNAAIILSMKEDKDKENAS